VNVFKPAPAHRNAAPAVCLCVDCSRIMLANRCASTNVDGHQCGDYRGHSGSHSLIVATVFAIAAERAAEVDESGPR
jgi:hypothetical protein